MKKRLATLGLTAIVAANTACSNYASKYNGPHAELTGNTYVSGAVVEYFKKGMDEYKTLLVYDLNGDGLVDEAMQANTQFGPLVRDYFVFSGWETRKFKHFVHPSTKYSSGVREQLISGGEINMTDEQQAEFSKILALSN